MPRIATPSCPYRRLANGEWIQESLQFEPVSFDFIAQEIHAKPELWNKQCLYTLRRLAYSGDPESVRTLSKLQGTDEQKNTELRDLARLGKVPMLAQAIEHCNRCLGFAGVSSYP